MLVNKNVLCVLIFVLAFSPEGFSQQDFKASKDSILRPILNLYNGDIALTAESLKGMNLKYGQRISVRLELLPDSRTQDSIPGLVAVADTVIIVFGRDMKTRESRIKFVGPLSFITLSWNFSHPIQKGYLIGIRIRYRYLLRNQILQTATITDYIKF